MCVYRHGLSIFQCCNLFFLSSCSLGLVLFIQPQGDDNSSNKKSNTHTHTQISMQRGRDNPAPLLY